MIDKGLSGRPFAVTCNSGPKLDYVPPVGPPWPIIFDATTGLDDKDWHCGAGSAGGTTPWPVHVSTLESTGFVRTMELQLCLAAALAGTLSFVPVHEAISLEALNVFGLILFATLALRTVYWVWIYPYYVSPLRHLPGPKVWHSQLSRAARAENLAAHILLLPGPSLPSRPGSQAVHVRESK